VNSTEGSGRCSQRCTGIFILTQSSPVPKYPILGENFPEIDFFLDFFF